MFTRLDRALALALTFLAASMGAAWAQCAVPVPLSNGQPADASQVMLNFNAIADCVDNLPGGGTNAVQYNAGSGALAGVGPLTNGQVIIGSTGNAPQAATLTAGANVSITNGPGSITISSSGGGGGGAAPVLVQAEFVRTTTTPGTVTLSSAPTVGNLLVAFASGYGDQSTQSVPNVPAAFARVYATFSSVSVAQGIVVGARVVQSGDGVSWPGFVGGNGGDVYAILEFSGAHAVQANAAPGRQSSTTWPFFSGSAANAYTFFVLENDVANAFSSIAGATLLFDGTAGPSNHPSVVATIAPGTAANSVVTYTGSSFGNSMVTTISVVP